MAWKFYNASGEVLSSFGDVALGDIDIDGATDIGAAIVDADLFIIDDGAGGTNRKTAASRIKTYIGGLSSDSTSGTRAAAAATGDVAYTGSSFTPTAVIIVAANDDNDDSVSVGFSDSALDEGVLELTRMSGTPRFVTGANVIAISSNSGNDAQTAIVKSFNADGVTLTWTKTGSGTQNSFRILYLG
jgi:hypothetical protein